MTELFFPMADTNRYNMIALCAGTRTYTTRAQERLIKTDPTAVRSLSHFSIFTHSSVETFQASSFLPFNFNAPPSSTSRATRSTPSWGTEYRAASKELSAVFNILFSIGGVGVAVYVVAKTSSGMRQESVSPPLSLVSWCEQDMTLTSLPSYGRRFFSRSSAHW